MGENGEVLDLGGDFMDQNFLLSESHQICWLPGSLRGGNYYLPP